MVERVTARMPIADQMYNVLLHQFMSGQRAAGESLNIGALSRELSVSQTPLREALARLEHTGLVEREALRGYRVAPAMTRGEVEQLMDARLMLEPPLAGKAAQRRSDAFIGELRQAVEDFEMSAGIADVDTDGFDLYWRSDDRFHTLIAAQAGNKFLELACGALAGQVQRFRLFSKLGRTGARGAAPEHRAIFDALAAGDAARADAAMRAHIIGATDRLLRR